MWTNAPSIGFNRLNIAKIVAIRFKINANAMPTLIVFKVFLDNLNKSSMYGGLDDIKGIGPRYCHELK